MQSFLSQLFPFSFSSPFDIFLVMLTRLLVLKADDFPNPLHKL